MYERLKGAADLTGGGKTPRMMSLGEPYSGDPTASHLEKAGAGVLENHVAKAGGKICFLNPFCQSMTNKLDF